MALRRPVRFGGPRRAAQPGVAPLTVSGPPPHNRCDTAAALVPPNSWFVEADDHTAEIRVHGGEDGCGTEIRTTPYFEASTADVTTWDPWIASTQSSTSTLDVIGRARADFAFLPLGVGRRRGWGLGSPTTEALNR